MRKRVVVSGPVLSQSGYGEQARFALRALRSREDLYDIFVVPLNWGQTGWVNIPNEERRWLDEKIAAAHHATQAPWVFDLSLQVGIPNEWKKLARFNIGYTAGIETTRVAPVWLEKANEMDRVIVVSNHSKDVFNHTSYTGKTAQDQVVNLNCTTPIEVVNYPHRKFQKQALKLSLDYDFNYLAISQWGPRKNFDNLINWFVEENFDQEVGLVLKTSIRNNCLIDRIETEVRLKNILSKHGDHKCKIYLLHGDLSEEEMTALYQHSKIKCLLSTSHGEGYGLPLFEAAYNGMPVVCHSWSGQRDFLYMPDKRRSGDHKKPMFASVEYDLKNVQPDAVWNGVIQADSQWAFPREGSFKRRLREMRTDYSRFKKKAKTLQKYIIANFSEERMYEQFLEAFDSAPPHHSEGLQNSDADEIVVL
jgi:glycosyltransferase involved in cell wall biosynthesis